jgi:uncharacterized membrane protein
MTMLEWMRDPVAQRVLFLILMVLLGVSSIVFRRQYVRIQALGFSFGPARIRRLERIQIVAGVVMIILGIGVFLFAR